MDGRRKEEGGNKGGEKEARGEGQRGGGIENKRRSEGG